MNNTYSRFFKKAAMRLIILCNICRFLTWDLLAENNGPKPFALPTVLNEQIVSSLCSDFNDLSQVIAEVEERLIGPALRELTSSTQVQNDDELRTLQTASEIDTFNMTYDQFVQILEAGSVAWRYTRGQVRVSEAYSMFIRKCLNIAVGFLNGDRHNFGRAQILEKMQDIQSVPNSSLYKDNLLNIKDKILPILQIFNKRVTNVGREWDECMKSAFINPSSIFDTIAFVDDMVSDNDWSWMDSNGNDQVARNANEYHCFDGIMENVDYRSYLSNLENALDQRFRLAVQE